MPDTSKIRCEKKGGTWKHSAKSGADKFEQDSVGKCLYKGEERGLLKKWVKEVRESHIKKKDKDK